MALPASTAITVAMTTCSRTCKTRYFCPSCHQKRMLAYGEWLDDHVHAPVPHRQYVFALPKLIRPFFRYRRPYLGALCRIVSRLLKASFKAVEPRGQPAFVLYVQTFGDLVTFNPHIHALVADGVFLPSGAFRVLPPLPEPSLCEALRHRVLGFLCAEGALAADLAQRMLGWRHSGFSVHNRIRSKASDAEGRQRLARYMIRCPFALRCWVPPLSGSLLRLLLQSRGAVGPDDELHTRTRPIIPLWIHRYPPSHARSPRFPQNTAPMHAKQDTNHALSIGPSLRYR